MPTEGITSESDDTKSLSCVAKHATHEKDVNHMMMYMSISLHLFQMILMILHIMKERTAAIHPLIWISKRQPHQYLQQTFHVEN